MINMLEELNVEFASDFDIQAGFAYDVTGLGTYVAPEDFVDGREGFSGINGTNSSKVNKLLSTI